MAKRLALAEGILRLLGPGGSFLAIEPSLLTTSRELLSLRDGLGARGCRILGPCLRQGPCPALAAGPGHTCHSEAPWIPPEPVASLAAAAGLDRDSVKMTWVAIGAPAAAGGTAATRLAPAEAGTVTALVVSEPMLNKAGRLRYLLCNESGRFAFSAKKDDAAATAAGFPGLRRGDRIRLVGTEQRCPAGPAGENRTEVPALGFLPSTGLEILAPAPSISGMRGKAGRHG